MFFARHIIGMEMLFALTIIGSVTAGIFILILLLLCICWIKTLRMRRLTSNMPRPKHYPLIGCILEFGWKSDGKIS